MFRTNLFLTLVLVGSTAMAQMAPATTYRPTSVTQESGTKDTSLAVQTPPSNYQPSDGTFGSHATCETADAPASKGYKESVDKALANYPGYIIFDQYDVTCGEKKALILVLVSWDGSKPSLLHAIDLTSFLSR